jgi:hypothetical protein
MINRVFSVVAVILVCVSVACVAGGVWIRRSMTSWMEGTATTNGRVMEMLDAAPLVAKVGYAPKVVFAIDGEDHTLVGAASTVQHFRVGDEVTVIFHPQTPSDAAILEERSPTWFVPLLFGAVGVFFAVVGVLMGALTRTKND